MRILSAMLKGLVFLTGVLIAAWVFMPWKQVGEAVLLAAAERTGASVGYSSVDGMSGGFAVRDLDARGLRVMGVPLNVSCKTLTIRPDLIASALNMAPTCDVAFTGSALGEISVTPMKKIPGITIGDGRFAVSAGSREILFEGLRSNGELAMAGALALVPAAAPPIRWANVLISVKSEMFEKELPSLQGLLPLQQESPGRWALRRSRPDNAKEGVTGQ
jgi:hypothetical protein